MIPLTDSWLKKELFFQIHLPLVEARELLSISPFLDRIIQQIHQAGVKCYFKSYAEKQFRHI